MTTMPKEWNGNLKDALRAEIESQEAMVMTTPHLSAIYHASRTLLALLDEKEGDRKPEPAVQAPKSAAVTRFTLTQHGREIAGRLKLGGREDLSDGRGLTLTDDFDVVLHTTDPAVVERVSAYFDGEIVETATDDENGPIHVLVGAIRLAIGVYDKSDDHTPHGPGSDCVRCNAAAAVFVHGDARRSPPPRRRRAS